MTSRPTWRRGRSPRLVLPSPDAEYNRENEAQTRRAIEALFLRFEEARANEVGDASLGVRRTATITIPEPGAGESYEGELLLGGTALLYQAVCFVTCRLRLYESEYARTQDAARVVTEDPVYPCLLDVTFDPPPDPDNWPAVVGHEDLGPRIRLRDSLGSGSPIVAASREFGPTALRPQRLFWRVDIPVGADVTPLPLVQVTSPFVYVEDDLPPIGWTPFVPGAEHGIGVGNVYHGSITKSPNPADSPWVVQTAGTVPAGNVVAMQLDIDRAAVDGMSDTASLVGWSFSSGSGAGALILSASRESANTAVMALTYYPRSGGLPTSLGVAGTLSMLTSTSAQFRATATPTETKLYFNGALVLTNPVGIPPEFYESPTAARFHGINGTRSLISSGMGMRRAHLGSAGSFADPELTIPITYLPVEA